VLGEDADEALDRAEHDAVDHDGALLRAVGRRVVEVEVLRHLEVELDGAALPGPAERVLEVEVDLGAVEGAVALVHDVVHAQLVEGVPEALGRRVPVLVGAHRVVGARRELHVIGEAEVVVDRHDEVRDVHDLLGDLLARDVEVGVVLREAPHAEQPVELSGLLVPVDHAELRQAEREVAVRAGLAGEDDGAAGAVHRLDGIILVVDPGGVHVLLVVVPVAGLLPQVAVEDLRGGDLLVAGGDVDLPPVGHEGVLERDAVRQEEREPGPLFGHHEDAELLAELAVVPLLGLLHHGEVLVEVLLVLEGGAVDAGEHLVVLVALPVGAGLGCDLEGLEALGVGEVGSHAHVDVVALLVEGDAGVLGKIADVLDLVLLASLCMSSMASARGSSKVVTLRFSFAILFISASMAARSSSVSLRSPRSMS
jgi:hypothetical protein